MGYLITYNLHLEIKPKHFDRALKIFNHLHSDEMLEKHARGYCSPPGKTTWESKWYSWVPNACYDNLQEAFENWRIIDRYDGFIGLQGRRFVVEGRYNCKLGQQDFLLQQLAPVLSPTCVLVTGEDGRAFRWIVERHEFREEDLSNLTLAEDSEDDDEKPSFGGGVGCATSAQTPSPSEIEEAGSAA